MITGRRLSLPVAAALATVFALTSVSAQTPYVPYFGKNQVRYDRFEWWTYETDHFVIYYRGGPVPQPGIILLGRVTGDVSIFDRPGRVTVRIERVE